MVETQNFASLQLLPLPTIIAVADNYCRCQQLLPLPTIIAVANNYCRCRQWLSRSKITMITNESNVILTNGEFNKMVGNWKY
jgi:hypothetical protein